MLTSIGGTPFPLERRRAAPGVRRRLGRESFELSRLTVRQMTGAATYGRLRYDIDATLAAHRCASARVDSRDPVVDSVLIAGHAGTAAAVRRSAWGEGAGDARRRRLLWPVQCSRQQARRTAGPFGKIKIFCPNGLGFTIPVNRESVGAKAQWQRRPKGKANGGSSNLTVASGFSNVAGRVVAVLGLSSEAQSGPWPDALPASAPIPSGYDDSRAI